jgi:hypothetical protein
MVGAPSQRTFVNDLVKVAPMICGVRVVPEIPAHPLVDGTQAGLWILPFQLRGDSRDVFSISNAGRQPDIGPWVRVVDTVKTRLWYHLLSGRSTHLRGAIKLGA